MDKTKELVPCTSALYPCVPLRCVWTTVRPCRFRVRPARARRLVRTLARAMATARRRAKPAAQALLHAIEQNFGTLAFCRRWLDDAGQTRHLMAPRDVGLVRMGAVRAARFWFPHPGSLGSENQFAPKQSTHASPTFAVSSIDFRKSSVTLCAIGRWASLSSHTIFLQELVFRLVHFFLLGGGIYDMGLDRSAR